MNAPKDTTADQIVSPDHPFHPPSGTMVPVKKAATMAPAVVA